MRIVAIMQTAVLTVANTGLLTADDMVRRSPELQVLDRFVGTWDHELTEASTVITNPAGELVVEYSWKQIRRKH